MRKTIVLIFDFLSFRRVISILEKLANKRRVGPQEDKTIDKREPIVYY